MRRLCVVVVALALGACTPPVLAPMSLTATESESEYAPYREKGTATINGQAFLTTRGGDVKVAAGRTVTLDPATSYAKEWYSKYGTSMARWAEAPTSPMFAAARRTTVADAQGKFRFADLPAGDYIVRTTVTWDVPTSAYVSNIQGGVVSSVVRVGAGESKDVILNQY